jgi:single-strand DNA-binding protein
VVVGNLTRDPELKSTYSGSSLAKMRIAVNDRIKKDEVWEDYANFFDVVVFGKQAESCAEWLSKGKRVGIDGRLRWSEWQNDEGQRRSKVEIIAEHVMFLTPKDSDGRGGSQPAGEVVVEDDDIPF